MMYQAMIVVNVCCDGFCSSIMLEYPCGLLQKQWSAHAAEPHVV